MSQLMYLFLASFAIVVETYSASEDGLKTRLPDTWISFTDIQSGRYAFNISAEDYIVLLHIQKTGGTTFEKHLVYDLDILPPCSCQDLKRRCICKRLGLNTDGEVERGTTWLISRFSVGWLCGLHPDNTELRKCLRGLRNLYMVTFLRDPVLRFLSEYRHVRRGATWKNAKVACKNSHTSCLDNMNDLQELTLDQFLDCKDNQAFNRQTRMLADFDLIGCNETNVYNYNQSILDSAMKNLKELSYFGLCEHQKASQVVFEKTFDLRFKEDFRQSEDNKTQILMDKLSPVAVDRIRLLNDLDVRLYEFGKDLFDQRFKSLTL